MFCGKEVIPLSHYRKERTGNQELLKGECFIKKRGREWKECGNLRRIGFVREKNS